MCLYEGARTWERNRGTVQVLVVTVVSGGRVRVVCGEGVTVHLCTS